MNYVQKLARKLKDELFIPVALYLFYAGCFVPMIQISLLD